MELTIIFVVHSLLFYAPGIICDCPEGSFSMLCYNDHSENLLEGHPLAKVFQLLIRKDISMCSQDVKYDVSLLRESTNKIIKQRVAFHDSITFPALVLKLPGLYTIKAKVLNKETSDVLPDKPQCRVKAVLIDPVAVITGGGEIVEPSGSETVVDGSESLEGNTKGNDWEQLDFQWNCVIKTDVTSGMAQEFCSEGNSATSEFKNRFLTIPKQYAVDGNVYKIMLKVRSKNQDNAQWVETTQIINFRRLVAELEIRCLKNCSPDITVPALPVILKANCVKSCENVKENEYHWKIRNNENFDYGQNSKYGQSGAIFFIKGNVLEDSKTYITELSLTGNTQGITVIEVKTASPPILKNCQVRPSSGTALLTQFQVFCEYLPIGLTCKIFSVESGKETLLEIGPILEHLYFKLPTGSKVLARVTDSYGYKSQQTINVDVKSFISQSDDSGKAQEQIDMALQSADEAIKHSPSAALQTLNAVTAEIGNLPPEAAKKTSVNTLDVLKKVDIQTGTIAQQVAQIADQVNAPYKKIPDPNIVKTSTTLCRNSAKTLLESSSRFQRAAAARAKAEENSK